MQVAASEQLGFDARNVLTLAIDPSLHHYSPDQLHKFYRNLTDRTRALPGVRSVNFTNVVPLSIGGSSGPLEALAAPGKMKEAEADWFNVSPGFFETLSIPLLRGRDFANESTDGPRVALINQELAAQLFPGGNAVGQLIYQPAFPGSPRIGYQVIGVVGNAKSRFISEEMRPSFYMSLAQTPVQGEDLLGTIIMIKTETNPLALADAVQAQIHSLDPNLPIFNIETMEKHVGQALLLPRLAGTLFGVFGASGLLLASIGLYGVVNFAVKRRTREIGIRMALGAEHNAVVRMVAGQGALMVAIGLVFGLAISLAVSRVAAALLFGVSPTDPLTFAGVSLILIAVALVAVMLPARRAAKLDPMIALRHE
jgi:predicted permease